MIEVELTREQIALLFSALKQAESGYTESGLWKACKELTKLHDSLYRQIFTFGQVD